MVKPQTIAHAADVYILINTTQQMFASVQNITPVYARTDPIECEEYNAQTWDEQYGADDSTPDTDTGSSRNCGKATSASESHGEHKTYKTIYASLMHRLLWNTHIYSVIHIM